MASFVALPNELLTTIVSHLRDRRIDPFDPVATKDLQNARLVSRSMLAVATPMLFENMVYDLKFYRKKDVDRLTEFVRINPELARYVRRIRVNVPPAIPNREIEDRRSQYRTRRIYNLELARHELARHKLARHVRLIRVTVPPAISKQEIKDRIIYEVKRISEDSWYDTRVDKIYENFANMLQAWTSEREIATREIRNKGSSIRDGLMLLPSLRHLEHGLSTYWQQELTVIKGHTLTENEIRTLPHCEDSVKTRHQALNFGFEMVLNSATDTITSLKLKDTLVWMNLGTATVPVSLQHLDLEMNTGREGTRGSDWTTYSGKQHLMKSVRLWGRRLRGLKQLKTLRLRLMHGGGRCTEYEKETSRVAQMDDLFIDPNNAEDRFFLPELQSLELLDCALRLKPLLTIIGAHQQTLKKLTLDRVTLFPNHREPYWREIGVMCKDAVPGLTYLRLTKLVTCRPRRFNDRHFNNRVGAEPTPEGWRSGLDDAMTYEWRKGGANGTGKEFIGFKCPWTCDEDENVREDSKASGALG